MIRNLALLALACFTLSCAKTTPRQTVIPTTRIEGLVYEDGATNPIPGVAVMAYDKYGTFISGDVTNIRGKYSIANLLPGDYILRIHSGEYGAGEKFAGEYYKNSYSWEDANPVNVKNNIVTTGINFLLDKGTTITGRMLDKNSKKTIPNSFFFIKTYTSQDDYITYFGQTDSTGNYIVNGIEPGKYRIAIEPDERIGGFYADTAITIKSTFDTIKGLDFEVTEGGAISGKVSPPTQLWIQVIGSEKSMEKQIDKEGNYLIAGLPAGKYIVKAYPLPKINQYAWQYWKNLNSESNADVVIVKNTDTTKNIDFKLKQEGIISGVTKSSQGFPLDYCEFELFNSYGEKIIEPVVSRNSSGYYEIHNLPPGEYILKAGNSSLNNNYHGKYYRDSYSFENAKKITVKSGETTPNIDFTLEPAGSIQGFVLCNNNLMSGDSIRFNVLAVNIKTNEIFSSKTTFTGGYKITGTPDGEYKLCAFAPGTEFSTIWAGGGKDFNDRKNTVINVNGKIPVDFNLSVAPRNSQISGTVYDLDSITIAAMGIHYDTLKIPLSGGKIIAYDKYGYIVQTADVGTSGYILKGLDAGKYFIKTYNFKGYKDKWYKNISTGQLKPLTLWRTAIPENTASIELKESQSLTGINFELK